MNLIAVSPARYASTRFPGKPLHPIAGRPLLQRVVERCRRARSLQDVVVATEFAATARAVTRAVGAVQPDELILDIGPATAARYAAIVQNAGTIVWNGPVGVFEIEQFGAGTRRLAEAVAQSPAFSIAGGGDTLAAIAKYGIEKDISYISTGGGAFLEVLEGKTLPAFEILSRRAAQN